MERPPCFFLSFHPTRIFGAQSFRVRLSSLAPWLAYCSWSALGHVSFPCTHGLQLPQTIPKTFCSAYSFFILPSLGWDQRPRVCQATALLPSHIPDSHLLILAPCHCEISMVAAPPPRSPPCLLPRHPHVCFLLFTVRFQNSVL